MNNSDLFLARFPEEALVHEMNMKRIRGFLKYTCENFERVSSIQPHTAEFITKLNELGFITFDSQEGIHKKKENPKKKNGKPVKIKGSTVIYEEDKERSYCFAFIRTDILHLFIEKLNEENQNLMPIVHPYNGPSIRLTNKRVKDVKGNKYKYRRYTGIYRTNIKDVELQMLYLSGYVGYYSGPPLEPLPIDINRWTKVTVFDTKWVHHALEENGLFKCIERALVKSLNNQV